MTREATEFVWHSRFQGKKIVFTNGVFDILHPGHVRYFHDARALGELLIVGANSDRSVNALNKSPDRPIHRDHERVEVLEALVAVDAVVIFDEDTPHEITEGRGRAWRPGRPHQTCGRTFHGQDTREDSVIDERLI